MGSIDWCKLSKIGRAGPPSDFLGSPTSELCAPRVRLVSLVRRQRGEALIAPMCQFGELLGRRLLAPFAQNARNIVILEHLDTRGPCLQPLVETGIARAVVRDAAGRVQLDGGERP